MRDQIAKWAYSLDVDRCVRVEVGQGLLDALRAISPAPPPDSCDRGPCTPHHLLLGLPLTVADDLAPLAWRTFDGAGQVVGEGSGLGGDVTAPTMAAAIAYATEHPGTQVRVEDQR